MKILFTVYFIFILTFNVIAAPIKSEKLKAGIPINVNEWASAVKLEENKLEVTFEFLIDEVEFIFVKNLNCNQKLNEIELNCSEFNAKFNPDKNIHRISTIFKKLCFSKPSSIYLTYLITVRTKDKKYYQHTSSIIVYTPENRKKLFQKNH